MSQAIGKSEVIAFFTALCRRESRLAFWSYDRTNEEQRSIEGYVASVNEAFLEIEDFDNESTFVVLAGVEFVQLELSDAPLPIRAIAQESFDFVLGFQTGKYACCVMAKDLRNTIAAE